MTDHDPPPSGAHSNPLDFDPPSSEELTSVLEGYEVLAFVGKGNMGTVYKARQPHLDRLVALKILPARAESGRQFIERFQREAQTMAKLRHDHIMTVHDFGETTDGRFIFIAMEWVEGNTLERAIIQENFTPRHVLAIVTQICDALQYAHEHGVIHRDIKPANIMLDVNGRVKIADFGLAKMVGPGEFENRLTHSTASIGMPDFVAPEQFDPGREVDHRADVYSIGVILYKMLTGYTPRGTFLPPTRKVAGLDPRLDEIVAKAMAAKPEDRYPQISQMWQDVADVHTRSIAAAGTEAPAPGLVTGRVDEKAPIGIPIKPDAAAKGIATAEQQSEKALAITVIAVVGSLALALGIVAVSWGIMSRSDSAATEAEPAADPAPRTNLKPGHGKAKEKERRVVSIRREQQNPTPPPAPPPAKKRAGDSKPVSEPPPENSPAPSRPSTVESPPIDPAALTREEGDPARRNRMPRLTSDPPASDEEPATSIENPHSEIEQRIVEVKTPFKERYENDIEAAHRAEVATLNTQYLAAIESARVTATEAGDLDGVLALQTETDAIDEMTGTLHLLPDLPAGSSETLQTLRAKYAEQRTLLEAGRDTDAAPLLSAYDKALETLQAELTRSMKIDDAVAVKTAREELRVKSPFNPRAKGLAAPPAGGSAAADDAPVPEPPLADGLPPLPPPATSPR